MENTTQKLTRRNAIAAAIEICKHDADTDAVCATLGWTVEDFFNALTRAQDAARSKKSGEPTASQIKNDKVIRDVLIPFVEAYGEPITSSVVRDNAGSPDILTAQKATTLIRRAVALGLLELSPFVTETVSAKTGKTVRHNVAYQVPGFVWDEFEPKPKRSKKSNEDNEN